MLILQKILEDSLRISNQCAKKNLEFVVGGGISADAVPFLIEINKVALNRFETRKCVFDTSKLNEDDIFLQD